MAVMDGDVCLGEVSAPLAGGGGEVFAAGGGRFLLGDCLESLRGMESDSVTLALTSPPYHNAINYRQHVEKLEGKVARWARAEVSYEEYREFLMARFAELLRVVQPGGHSVVNIAPVGWAGRRVALPFHFVGWMEALGWRFKEDIIWEKEVVRDKRSGVLMQHPYPGYYYPSLSAEYVFVFQKPAAKKGRDNIFYYRSAEEKAANRLSLEGYQAMSKNIWTIRPVAPRENVHPCPFPEELARRVIAFYSYKRDVVLDIFCGSGVTNLVAEKLGRRHVGMECERAYVEYAVKKVGEVEEWVEGGVV